MSRARLVQTFLLAVLFSYQKMVIRAFTLVQCVDTGNRTAVDRQENIKCSTWWQYVTEMYIALNPFPLLFLSLLSVRMFILGCLFPVPVILSYNLQRFVKKRGVKKFSHSNIALSSEDIVGKIKTQGQRGMRSGHCGNVKVDDCCCLSKHRQSLQK